MSKFIAWESLGDRAPSGRSRQHRRADPVSRRLCRDDLRGAVLAQGGERAEAAANAAVLRARAFDELMNLTAAITTLDEIRRLHRLQQWTLLPDRYTSLRRTLVLVKSSSVPLTGNQRAALQAALMTLQGVERAVENGISKRARLDGGALNTLLAPHLDSLLIVLGELKSRFTDHGDGKN